MKLEKVDDKRLINMDLLLSISHIDNYYSFYLMSGVGYHVSEDKLNPAMKQYVAELI